LYVLLQQWYYSRFVQSCVCKWSWRTYDMHSVFLVKSGVTSMCAMMENNGYLDGWKWRIWRCLDGWKVVEMWVELEWKEQTQPVYLTYISKAPWLLTRYSLHFKLLFVLINFSIHKVLQVILPVETLQDNNTNTNRTRQ
jgi:hypothetical protein